MEIESESPSTSPQLNFADSSEHLRHNLRPRKSGTCYIEYFEEFPDTSTDSDDWKQGLVQHDISDALRPKEIPVFASEIMIGEEYQADVPELFSPEEKLKYHIEDEQLCQWRPNYTGSDEMTEEYLEIARKTTMGKQFTVEQLLGVFWFNGYQVSRTLQVLRDCKRVNIPSDCWATDAEKKFRKAFDKYGKDFERIRNEKFPDRPLRSLINFYYEKKAKKKLDKKWKKNKDMLYESFSRFGRPEESTKDSCRTHRFPFLLGSISSIRRARLQLPVPSISRSSSNLHQARQARPKYGNDSVVEVITID